METLIKYSLALGLVGMLASSVSYATSQGLLAPSFLHGDPSDSAKENSIPKSGRLTKPEPDHLPVEKQTTNLEQCGENVKDTNGGKYEVDTLKPGQIYHLRVAKRKELSKYGLIYSGPPLSDSQRIKKAAKEADERMENGEFAKIDFQTAGLNDEGIDADCTWVYVDEHLNFEKVEMPSYATGKMLGKPAAESEHIFQILSADRKGKTDWNLAYCQCIRDGGDPLNLRTGRADGSEHLLDVRFDRPAYNELAMPGKTSPLQRSPIIFDSPKNLFPESKSELGIM